MARFYDGRGRAAGLGARCAVVVHSGLWSAGSLAGRAGLDMSEARRLEAVRAMFEDANFVTHLGISFESAGYGWCEAALREPRPSLMQQSGTFHAGVLTTMADHTAGGALVSQLSDGLGVVSVDLSISLMRAAGGPLRCRGESLRCGKRLGVAEATVYAAEEGGKERAVAKAKVTLAIIPWTAKSTS